MMLFSLPLVALLFLSVAAVEKVGLGSPRDRVGSGKGICSLLDQEFLRNRIMIETESNLT